MGQPRDQASIIRAILEGTAGETGEAFFAALVRNVAGALGVAGAWVTEYLAGPRRLRALAFWFENRFVPDYEYAIAGTPCEPVIDQKRLLHIADNVVELFPRDPDLREFRAISYLGVPLLGNDGAILGHLAAIDTRPTPLDDQLEAVFRIFAARATAELHRLRAEAEIREREEQLSSLVGSAMDAVIEVDDQLRVMSVNPSGATVFGAGADDLKGRDFRSLLAPGSRDKLERLTAELRGRPAVSICGSRVGSRRCASMGRRFRPRRVFRGSRSVAGDASASSSATFSSSSPPSGASNRWSARQAISRKRSSTSTTSATSSAKARP